MCRVSNFKGWVTLRLNFRLKGVSRQYLWTVTWENGYNFAGGRFHTKKLCSRIYSIEIEFYFRKQQESLFEPPFGDYRGNVRTPSIARWKARGRLPIRHNWTFFVISYGWDVISGNLSKLALFEGDHCDGKFRAEGASPTNHCWCQKTRVIVLSCGIKISAVLFHFVIKHACDRRTDTQANGQDYLQLPRRRAAISSFDRYSSIALMCLKRVAIFRSFFCITSYSKFLLAALLCIVPHSLAYLRSTLWTEKSTPKCFLHTVYKTWPIVIKFGTYCSE